MQPVQGFVFKIQKELGFLGSWYSVLELCPGEEIPAG